MPPAPVTSTLNLLRPPCHIVERNITGKHHSARALSIRDYPGTSELFFVNQFPTSRADASPTPTRRAKDQLHSVDHGPDGPSQTGAANEACQVDRAPN